MSLMTRLMKDSPRFVDMARTVLSLNPHLLALFRRTLFYSKNSHAFPFDLLPTGCGDSNLSGSNLSGSAPCRTIFVDVSATARYDGGTGISRVTRQLLGQWLKNPPVGWRISPIYSDGIKYYNFLKFSQFPDRKRHEEISPEPSDLIILLDLDVYVIREMSTYLDRLKKQGVLVFVLMYDLIPVLYPNVFLDSIVENYRLWLDVVLRRADGIISISRTVADDLRRWVDAHPPDRSEPLQIGFAHLGADLGGGEVQANSENATLTASTIGKNASFLMVGTIEARKGHAQALEAFEMLWSRGLNVNLVIVGRPGWKVDALIARLKTHPEVGRRLFWFGNADDSLLSVLYKRCSALLAASEAEGFGLPLVEAAQRNMPIIARNISIFREVAGDHAYYFSGGSGTELSDEIEKWLELFAADRVPRPEGLEWITWERSASNFMELLTDRNASGWLEDWQPGKT